MRENRKGAVKDLQINLVFFQFYTPNALSKDPKLSGD
jgi:hypothetical protein